MLLRSQVQPAAVRAASGAQSAHIRIESGRRRRIGQKAPSARDSLSRVDRLTLGSLALLLLSQAFVPQQRQSFVMPISQPSPRPPAPMGEWANPSTLLAPHPHRPLARRRPMHANTHCRHHDCSSCLRTQCYEYFCFGQARLCFRCRAGASIWRPPSGTASARTGDEARRAVQRPGVSECPHGRWSWGNRHGPLR